MNDLKHIDKERLITEAKEHYDFLERLLREHRERAVAEIQTMADAIDQLPPGVGEYTERAHHVFVQDLDCRDRHGGSGMSKLTLLNVEVGYEHNEQGGYRTRLQTIEIPKEQQKSAEKLRFVTFVLPVKS